jgi:capsular exopolysaccharide synthesis family protein
VLVVLTLLGALVGWVTTPGADATDPLAAPERFYQATHTLIGDTSLVVSVDESGSGSSGINLTQAAYFATAGEVPARVAERLGIDVETVEQNVTATPRADVNAIDVTAIGSDITLVSQLADTTANELVTYLTEQAQAQYDKALNDVLTDLDELRAERQQIQDQLAAGQGDPEELQAQLSAVINQLTARSQRFQTLSDIDNPAASLSTLDVASPTLISEDVYDQKQQQILLGPDYTPPTTTPDGASSVDTEPAEPGNPISRAALGAMLGLAIAVGAILGLDRFDTRLRRRDDVEQTTGLPVLAEIPPMSSSQQKGIEVVAASNPRSRAAEAYRVVRSAIMFAATAESAMANGNGNGRLQKPLTQTGHAPDLGPQVIMVTSPGPGEGKTTTTANLAAVLAEGGLSVLVINCDFRRPRVHKYLVHGESTQASSESVMVPGGDEKYEVRAMRTDIPKVKLITGIGENDPHANPLEIVAVQRRILHSARSHFDAILLDTAPILTTNDASELLPECDHVVMVIRNGKTKREAAQRTAEILTRFEAPTLGVVFNGSDDTPAVQYYYNYYLDSTGKRVRGPGYLDSGEKNARASTEPIDAAMP